MDRQGASGQSRGYALFFLEDRLALEQAEETLFRTLLELRHSASIRFQLRRGRLLLRAFASRTTEITAEPTANRATPWRPGVGWVETLDSDLYLSLLYDFCDAINWEWHRLRDEDISEHFNSAHIHVLAISSLPSEVLERIHERMCTLDAYLGITAIDTGNPVMMLALWTALIHDYDYADGELGRFDRSYSDDERWDLKDDHWWQLEFDSIRWTSPSEQFDDVPTLEGTVLSERGRISEALLRERRSPTTKERVAASLRATIDTDKISVPVRFMASHLPQANDPEVPLAKLTQYALNPQHQKGKHKARLFEQLMGLTGLDAYHLAAQLRDGLKDAEVHRAEVTSFGVQYDTLMQLEGANGVIVPLIAGWIIRPNGRPQLVTCYPAKKGVLVPHGTPVVSRPALVGPIPSAADYGVLWSQAVDEGRRQAEATIPTPIKLVGGAWVPEGIGWAWVRVHDARKGFSRWLLANGHAVRGNRSGVLVFAERIGQSYDRALSWARGFAKILLDNGISCEVESHYD